MNKSAILVVLSFLASAAGMLTLLYYMGYAPFGGRSLASYDINYAQLDLYGYLKDILEGRNSFGYTLSVYLGSITTNVISYAMVSPLNFILALFPKEQFIIAFDLMAVVKIGLISAIMSYYLHKRFENKLGFCFTFILSICYGYSQYAIAQIVNIFWLDGMMLLPLILLGIYKCIHYQDRKLFSISVALSLIFNWYTGAINCIFCVFWFVLEILLYSGENKPNRKSITKSVWNCFMGGLTGVLLACFILVPTFLAIGKGNRGQINIDSSINAFSGNPITVLTNYGLGSQSSQSVVSLFCGSLSLLGCIAFFFEKEINRKTKVITGCFLLFTCLAFYWRPLIVLFSMLKEATSFWSRYGYIGIFPIVFVAAYYFSIARHNKTKNIFALYMSLLAWGGLFLFSHINETGNNLALVNMTVLFGLAGVIISGWYIIKSNKRIVRIVAGCLLVAICFVEMLFNTSALTNRYAIANCDDYSNYVTAQKEQIAKLKEYDQGQYRITQTLIRNSNIHLGGTSANYNEPLGYGYWGITGYTNSPNDRQRSFLDRVGYRTNGENYYIVNTSILGIDSLLGIKYLLSPFDIQGYKTVDQLGEYNQKKTYINPYAMPMAFLCDYHAEYLNEPYQDPFLYQNQIYSALLGYNVELYEPLEYTINVDEWNRRSYEIWVPEGDYALYCNFPWTEQTEEEIRVNGQLISVYAIWGSPKVVYIPWQQDNRTITLDVVSGQKLSIADSQIYALDLYFLKAFTDELKSQGEIQSFIDNRHAEFTFSNEESKYLFVSIGYDEGWEIRDNGEIIKPETLGDCLMLIPAEPGTHHIEMNYHIPGMKAGICLSIVGILLFVGQIMYKKKKERAK